MLANAQNLTLTGDVTGTGANTIATTIAANAVTYAKFQQVAASSLVGNATGSLANAAGITLGATLGFSGSALQTLALSGDISTPANSFVTTIGTDKVLTTMILNSNVTLAKLANIADQTILGNNTGGSAAPVALTAAQTKVVLSLNLVENTALSTWAGSANLTTLGTIATGVWQATSIATTYTDAKIKTVTGTSNRLTIAGTATDPTFDISTSYVGQATITTLGTIATGVWNGTKVAEIYGGTNQATYATGDILYASASNTLSKLAASTNGFVLTLAAGVPSWSAVAAAPAGANPTGTIGLTAVNGSATTFLRSDGAPALSQAISPTWSGTHTFSNTIVGSVNGNAATVTTNANLTGPITSVGNATAIASQTGTGTTFMMSASPTTTGTLTGAAANFSGAVQVTGRGSFGGNIDTDAGLTLATGLNSMTGDQQVGFKVNATYNSSATTAGDGIRVQVKTAASAFTCGNGVGIRIQNAALGAGSSMSTQFGLYIESMTSASAGNNYAIVTGAGLVQFGGALAVVSGNVGIATGAISDFGLYVAAITGTGTGQSGITSAPTFPTTATAYGDALQVRPILAPGLAQTSTLGIRVQNMAKGAGATSVIQYGIYLESMSGATTNYALVSNLGLVQFGDAVTCTSTLAVTSTITASSLTASQAVFTNGSKQLVSNAITGSGSVMMSASPTTTGTLTAAAADFSGAVSIAGTTLMNSRISMGTIAGTSRCFQIFSTFTDLAGATQVGIQISPTYQSAAVTVIDSIRIQILTEAAAFTCATASAVHIQNASKGAGSAITNLYGLRIDSQTGGSTLNLAIATGAGDISFGDSVACLSTLTVSALTLTVASTTGSAGLRIPHGTAPTAPVNGDIWTTTLGLYVRINGLTLGPLT